MSRFPRLAVLLAAAALMIVMAPASAAPAASSDDPTASASRVCSVGDSRSYGTTYVRWIRAKNFGCRKARKLVRAFHDCRPGAKGRCKRVKRFRCRENRTVGRGSYDSTVKCKRGRKVVKHGYTQWT